MMTTLVQLSQSVTKKAKAKNRISKVFMKSLTVVVAAVAATLVVQIAAKIIV